MKNKYLSIIRKAQKLNKENQKIRESYAYTRVIGLLSGLGFLIAPGIPPTATIKVDIMTALEMGLKVEPRILEVLPAAILSFPKSFLHLETIPSEFDDVLKALKRGAPGPAFGNISFDKFLEAAKRPIKNKKGKTIEEKRIAKTFRLSPQAIHELKAKANNEKKTYTAYLENLIFSA